MSTFCKMRKGDIALVEFDSAITKADFSTVHKPYYQFCIVAHTDRQGRVKQVSRKGSNAVYPVTSACYRVSPEDVHGVNPVHFLGGVEFASIEDAKIALLTLAMQALSPKEAA